MYQNISFSQFCDAFYPYRKDQFSYEGKRALYDYLGDLEDDTGGKIEFDMIALCCEYTEYKDLKELQDNYNDIDSLEKLENYTVVIPIEGTDRFIIQDF